MASEWRVIVGAIALSTVTLSASAEDTVDASAPTPAPAEPIVDAKLAQARAIVAAAEPLFIAGHYSAALAEYSRAYEVLEGHPRQYWVLHNLAACHERLFRYDVALELMREDGFGELKMVTHTYPLEEYRAALTAALDKNGYRSVKVVFRPGD